MHRGSIGILDGYGMRGYLMDLLAKGFDVKIVGHSLGAGAFLIFTLVLILVLVFIHNNDPPRRYSLTLPFPLPFSCTPLLSSPLRFSYISLSHTLFFFSHALQAQQ